MAQAAAAAAAASASLADSIKASLQSAQQQQRTRAADAVSARMATQQQQHQNGGAGALPSIHQPQPPAASGHRYAASVHNSAAIAASRMSVPVSLPADRLFPRAVAFGAGTIGGWTAAEREKFRDVFETAATDIEAQYEAAANANATPDPAQLEAQRLDDELWAATDPSLAHGGGSEFEAQQRQQKLAAAAALAAANAAKASAQKAAAAVAAATAKAEAERKAKAVAELKGERKGTHHRRGNTAATGSGGAAAAVAAGAAVASASAAGADGKQPHARASSVASSHRPGEAKGAAAAAAAAKERDAAKRRAEKLDREQKRAAAVAESMANGGGHELSIKKERFIQLLDKMDLLFTDAEQQRLNGYLDGTRLRGGPLDERLITEYFPAHFKRFDRMLSGFLERRDFLDSCADFARVGATILVAPAVASSASNATLPTTTAGAAAAASLAAPSSAAATPRSAAAAGHRSSVSGSVPPIPEVPPPSNPQQLPAVDGAGAAAAASAAGSGGAAAASGVPAPGPTPRASGANSAGVAVRIHAPHRHRFSDRLYDSLVNRAFPDKVDRAAFNPATGKFGVDYRLNVRDYTSFMTTFVWVMHVYRDVPPYVTFDKFLAFLSRDLAADYTRADLDSALTMLLPWPRLPVRNAKSILSWYAGCNAARNALSADPSDPNASSSAGGSASGGLNSPGGRLNGSGNAPPAMDRMTSLLAAARSPPQPQAPQSMAEVVSRTTRAQRTSSGAATLVVSDNRDADRARAAGAAEFESRLRAALPQSMSRDTDWLVNSTLVHLLSGPNGESKSADTDGSGGGSGDHTLNVLHDHYMAIARADPLRRGTPMLRHLLVLKDWGTDPPAAATPPPGSSLLPPAGAAATGNGGGVPSDPALQTVADRKYEFSKKIHQLKHEFLRRRG